MYCESIQTDTGRDKAEMFNYGSGILRNTLTTDTHTHKCTHTETLCVCVDVWGHISPILQRCEVITEAVNKVTTHTCREQ